MGMDENDENKAPVPARKRILIVDSHSHLRGTAIAALLASVGARIATEEEISLEASKENFGFDPACLVMAEYEPVEDRATFKRQGGRDYESAFSKRKRSPRRR